MGVVAASEVGLPPSPEHPTFSCDWSIDGLSFGEISACNAFGVRTHDLQFL